MDDNSYRLIVEYFDKTITDDGLTQLQQWIEESPENLAQFSETIEILEASKSYFSQPGAQRMWAQIDNHISGQKTGGSSPKLKIFTYAAACIVACVVGWFGYMQLVTMSSANVGFEVISNTDGKKTKVLLPDSSVVYLGGGSKIKFAKRFKGKERKVYLNGEAFFEVVHQTEKPFVVQNGDIKTVVLGTSFNVMAYAADKKVAVSVKTGKVGVMAAVHGRQQLVKYLLPGQQININTQNGLYTFNAVDIETVNTWTENKLNYYNTSFKEIATSIEHHYGVKIEFTEAELAKVKLTAKFSNAPLNEVMKTLTALSGLAYTQSGNHIFISNNYQQGGKIMK